MNYPKVRLMSVVLARRNSGKDHMRRLCTKKDAPAKLRGIWRTCIGTHFEKNQRGARNRSRFRSINAHEEQKRLKLRWIGHFAKVQNPYSSVDCQWWSAHPRGGTRGLFMTWISSYPSNYSRKHLLSYRKASFAMITDTPLSGSAVKGHDWPNMGRLSSAKRTLSYLLPFQGYPPILAAFRPLHRHHRNRREKKWK